MDTHKVNLVGYRYKYQLFKASQPDWLSFSCSVFSSYSVALNLSSFKRSCPTLLFRNLTLESLERVTLSHSQADIKKFPTRQSFANVVLEGFSQGNLKVVLQYWVCCLERHQESPGVHYHMAVVFSGKEHWLSAKQFLLKNNSISAHFADKKHHDYYQYVSAYHQYVTKEDSSALLCPDHRNFALGRSPHTSKSSRAGVEKSSRKRSSASEAASSDQQPSKPSKARRPSNIDIANLVISECIYDGISLLAHAKEQNELGKPGLANFLLSRSAKINR